MEDRLKEIEKIQMKAQSFYNDTINPLGIDMDKLTVAAKVIQAQYNAINTKSLQQALQAQMKAISINSTYQQILEKRYNNNSLAYIQGLNKFELQKDIDKIYGNANSIKWENIFKQIKKINEMTLPAFSSYKEAFQKLKTIYSSFSYISELVKSAELEIQKQNEALQRKENTETAFINNEQLFTNEEFEECVIEADEKPLKFQERFANWSEEKKKQWKIAYMTLKIILSIFILPYLQQYIGLPVMTRVVSSVKELPKKAAPIIDRIEKDFKVVVTENTNYYYKINYIDENGERKEGYVNKRNVKFIEEK